MNTILIDTRGSTGSRRRIHPPAERDGGPHLRGDLQRGHLVIMTNTEIREEVNRQERLIQRDI